MVFVNKSFQKLCLALAMIASNAVNITQAAIDGIRLVLGRERGYRLLVRGWLMKVTVAWREN